MHIYFSGIGGTGIGPLAQVAKQAGYEVSGSDVTDSSYLNSLTSQGISNIHVGQDTEQIAAVHAKKPINWFVYSSALPKTDPNHPELTFCKENGIKTSKRDELLNEILSQKKLKLIAVAGTHGKTTTTAMIVWLFKQLDIPISYSVGAKLSFGDMGEYAKTSEYFIYEADEYDRNFLAFQPFMSLVSGVDWDHPDIYPTREEYYRAFKKFISQSQWSVLWHGDAKELKLSPAKNVLLLHDNEEAINKIKLPGHVNRLDAWLAAKSIFEIIDKPLDELIDILNSFPGLSRRFENIAPNVYSDYAHTPGKIRGALQMAREVIDNKTQVTHLDGVQGAGEQRTEPYMKYGEGAAQSVTPQSAKSASRVGGSADKSDSAMRGLVVVYEGLHNLRQHFIKDELKTIFDDVKKLYIVPSYLAREDPNLPTLSPENLKNLLSQQAQKHTEVAQLDEKLKENIKKHAGSGETVLCLSAGGSGSLDEWLRQQF
ncbi:hypothetical protein HYS84_03995 [Candidatus Saccharibacteria bacterium]|nr:hypothetical protein [Candidatus Saccharibacteria bacterium]